MQFWGGNTLQHPLHYQSVHITWTPRLTSTLHNYQYSKPKMQVALHTATKSNITTCYSEML